MYFENFPKITYSFKINDNKPDETIIVKDITQNVRFRKEVFDKIKFYDTYKIKDGDTPEMISEKVYGSPEYHWVIMLINQKYNYIDDFAKDAWTIEDTIAQKYGKHRGRAHHFVNSNLQVINGSCTIKLGKTVIGKIRTTPGEVLVYGVKTNFTKDLVVGNKLYTNENVLLGTVDKIIDDELIYLVEICPIAYNNTYKCQIPVQVGMVVSMKTSNIGYVSGYINAVSETDPFLFDVTLTNGSFFVNDFININQFGEDSEKNFLSTNIGSANIISIDYPIGVTLVSYQDNEYTKNENNRELKIIPKADLDQILSEFTDLI